MTDKKPYEPDDTNQEPQKSEAQIKSEKFEANPDQFEDLSTVLISIKRHHQTGQIMVLNNCKSVDEAWAAFGHMMTNIQNMIQYLNVKAMKERQAIAQHNGNFLQNLRNNLKRK